MDIFKWENKVIVFKSYEKDDDFNDFLCDDEDIFDGKEYYQEV